MKNPILWTNPKKKRMLILTNKGRQNTIDIISTLALNGNCTTGTVAKIVLKQNMLSKSEPTPYELTKKRIEFFNRIRDRPKKHGEKIPGLISKGFIIHVGNELGKNKPDLYSLSLRGCFLALGLNLKENELKKLIFNFSNRYLFFSYLQDVIEINSFNTVKKFILDPIEELVSTGKISLDQDFGLSFSTIADQCSLNLFHDLMKKKNSLKNKRNRKKVIYDTYKWADFSYSGIIGLKIFDTADINEVHDCKLTHKVTNELGNTFINFTSLEL